VTIRSSTDVLHVLADGRRHTLPPSATHAADGWVRKGVAFRIPVGYKTGEFAYQIRPGVLSAARKLCRLGREDERAREPVAERMPRRPTHKGIPPIAVPTEMSGELQYAWAYALRDGWTDEDITEMIHEMRT
jgi:hypothetical protein